MPKPSLGVWLTTVLWIAVAGGLWARHDYQLRNGREISLKAVPVDPRDVLRGDYVILRYGISRVAPKELASSPQFREDQTVFVSLEEKKGGWAVGELHPSRPEDGLFLRGRVRKFIGAGMEIEYGIESFFVPEGEGRRYEEARNRRRLYAVISVSPHGVAHLKRLEIRDPESSG